MLEKIKKYIKSIYFPFITFGIILIIFHIPMIKIADDCAFSTILSNYNIFDYVAVRYITWSSRVVIDFLLIIMSSENVSMVIWKILDIAMFEILAYSTYKIFIKDLKNDNKKIYLSWILVSGILVLPLSSFCDAGWIATTMNYLWVLALRYVCFYIIKKEFKSRKNKMVSYNFLYFSYNLCS